jgi:micrococcal nuclease
MMDYLEFDAIILEHKDGDTTVVEVDLGFEIYHVIELRWLGVDSPEKATELGKITMAKVNEILPPSSMVIVRTIKVKPREVGPKFFRVKKEKFGRYLGEFYLREPIDGSEMNVNRWLVDNGYAREYWGGKRTWLTPFRSWFG